LNVGIDRPLRDVQLVGGLAVGETKPDQVRNLALARGQR